MDILWFIPWYFVEQIIPAASIVVASPRTGGAGSFSRRQVSDILVSTLLI